MALQVLASFSKIATDDGLGLGKVLGKPGCVIPRAQHMLKLQDFKKKNLLRFFKVILYIYIIMISRIFF